MPRKDCETELDLNADVAGIGVQILSDVLKCRQLTSPGACPLLFSTTITLVAITICAAFPPR
jgi:hypothetical protein